jgi:hypothetical protein
MKEDLEGFLNALFRDETQTEREVLDALEGLEEIKSEIKRRIKSEEIKARVLAKSK